MGEKWICGRSISNDESGRNQILPPEGRQDDKMMDDRIKLKSVSSASSADEKLNLEL